MKKNVATNMHKQSIIFTVDGEFTYIPTPPNERPFFRKCLNRFEDYAQTELEIVERIQQTSFPTSNLVTIYNINREEGYYDMELLDVTNISHTYTTYSQYKQDIKTALNQLHALNIVYIDIKDDNIGYSHVDRRWKLFDFDVSGVVDTENPLQWKYPPVPFYNYKKAMRLIKEQKIKLTYLQELDDLLYIDWVNSVLII